MADHHDRLIKDLLNNRDFSLSFLRQYVQRELVALIDWSSVELGFANVEHTRQQHKKNVKQKEQSDLAFLFKFKDGRQGAILVHIEVQSTDDMTILIRSRHYQTAYLLDFIKRNKGVKKLPLVVSIIYYTNKKPFSYSTDINDYFENKELAEKFAFTTQFVDLVSKSDEEILQHDYIKGLEIILKYAAKKDIDSVLALAAKTITDYDSFSRQTLIKYMSDYSNLDFDQFYDKIVNSNIDLQGDVMTVSQQIEERALQKHAPILKAEGRHLAHLATARNMLLRGYDAKEVAELNNLSIEEVNALADEVKGKKH